MLNQELSSSSKASTVVQNTFDLLTGTGISPSGDYDYNLPILPQEEFDLLHTFVLAIFDQGRQRFKMDLKTVTVDPYECPENHLNYLLTSDSLGVSMTARFRPEEFHIWINPAYKKPVFKFYMTLVHELVHGYAGMSYGHNAHWRRWFYRTLWHLHEVGFIPRPVDELKMVCLSVEYTYRNGEARIYVDPMLTILEAFSKAEKEHDQVKANYFKRLRNA